MRGTQMIRIGRVDLTFYSWPVLVALTVLVLAATLVLPRIGRAATIEYPSKSEMRAMEATSALDEPVTARPILTAL